MRSGEELMHSHERQSNNRGQFNFRCADAGHKSCDWQVSGNSEEEIMPRIEQHGREKHNMKIDDETKRKVRRAIQRKTA